MGSLLENPSSDNTIEEADDCSENRDQASQERARVMEAVAKRTRGKQTSNIAMQQAVLENYFSQGDVATEARKAQTVDETLFNVLLAFVKLISVEDTSGGDAKGSIQNAIWALRASLNINAIQAPFLVDPDGDCLFTSFAFARDPTKTKKENARTDCQV